MANSNSPFGLRPVGTLGTGAYSGKVSVFYATNDTHAIGIGDPVVLTGTGDANGVPAITRSAATTDTIVGIVVGTVPDPDNLTKNFKPASTARYLLVDCDPNTIFEVQGGYDGTNASTITNFADIGNNVQLAMGTVDTTTGNSKTKLSTTFVTAGATTGQVQILRASTRADNDLTTTAPYSKWLVRLNYNQYKANTASKD
jgi:hypothetical protein